MRKASQTSLQNSNANIALVMSILVIVPFVIYWQATGFDLVSDDVKIHLTDNPYLHPVSSENLLHFWKEPYRGLYIPVAYNLWSVLAAISTSISSSPHDPFIYHLANIILHTLNGVLVFALLRQFIKSPWAALAGALLFLAHPLQVETVSFVSEFRGLTAAFFSFTALYLYIKNCSTKYGNTGFKLSGLYSSICFLLALLSKPSAAILPLFAVSMEYYLYRPSLKQLYAKSWLWLWVVISAVIAIVTSSLPVQDTVTQSTTLWVRPLIWMDAVSFYLYKLLVPLSLAFSYARTPEYVIGQWWFYMAWIAPVGIGSCLWYARNRIPGLVLAALLFLFGFLPVSGLVEFIFQEWSTVADRYLYLSMLGVSLGFGYFADRSNQPWQWVIFGSVIVLLGVRSFVVQVPVWENSFTLWNHCIEVTPVEAQAYNNRGCYYHTKKEYDKAVSDFSKTVAINSKHAQAYYNRGNVYYAIKEFDKAVSDYSKAIAIKPKYAKAYNNRGLVYDAKKEFDKAVSDYNKAVAINPKYADAYYNRGIVYFAKRELDKAVSDYSKAVDIDPEYAKAYYNRGIVYFAKREFDKAVADYSKAVAIDPEYADAYYNRGCAYDAKKEFGKAVADYSKAVAIDPKHIQSYNNRGIVYYNKKEYDKAVADYSKAIAINPEYAKAFYNRATAWYCLKEYEKALSDTLKSQNFGFKVNPQFLQQLKNLVGR